MPVATTALAGGLALASAALSLSTAPRYSYFAAPRAGSAPVVAALHAAAQQTVGARGFVLRMNGLVIDYAAPDRTRTRDPYLRVVVIGRTLYVGRPGGVGWVESRLATTDVPFGPVWVRGLLAPYLETRSVERRGSTYVVRRVAPASDFVPSDAGQALVTAWVEVHGGAVVGVRARADGLFPGASRSYGPRDAAGVVTRIRLVSVTFGAIGRPERIVAPRRDVTRGTLCDYGPALAVGCRAAPGR